MNSRETPCIESASPCSHIVVVSSLLHQHQTESSYIQPSILLYYIYIFVLSGIAKSDLRIKISCFVLFFFFVFAVVSKLKGIEIGCCVLTIFNCAPAITKANCRIIWKLELEPLVQPKSPSYASIYQYWSEWLNEGKSMIYRSYKIIGN